MNMAPILLPIFLGAVTLASVAALAIEARRHRQRLRTVQHRVHVNGIRGKTEVTELIGGAMRIAGIRTWSKTTGKATRVVDHHGDPVPFERTGPPNVREQMEFVQMASDAGARGMAVECMAVTPELQMISARMVCPTIGVITNVRLEHTDVMGPGIEDIADALAETIPENGTLVTGDRRYYRHFRDIARSKGTTTILADGRKLPDDLKEAFTDHPHIENVAVAWNVCKVMGIGTDAMARTAGSGNGSSSILEIDGISVEFIDALGANDAGSTMMALKDIPRPDVPLIGLFIGRADRPGRAVEMAEEFMSEAGFDRCFAIGPGAKLFASRTPGIEVSVLPGKRGPVLDGIAREMGRDHVLFAFGNRTGRTAMEFLVEVKD